MARDYRKDIDGLRAIAIAGVVIDHAGFAFLPGGFGGVDVFFVISGFLIGGHIFEDLAVGRFSFRRFYARRFRRIYPALVTVLLATLVAGWFVMLPHDYRYMGGAGFTALLSLSNIWFWQTIDYFRPEAAHDPLIHTWSLGVEEQFYLIVPLLLAFLWRWRRGAPAWLVPGLLAGLVALSLGTALLSSGEYRMEAFYLLHTRAWELFGGVFVAWLAHRRAETGAAALAPALATALSAAGLLLILTGMALVPQGAAWPGLWTLPATLGTALVLFAGRDGLPVSRLLALAPLRFVGLVSYSLYLWHQPVFSLTAQAGRWPESPWGVLAILILLLALSALSWRFVEQPFRRSARLAAPRRLVLAGAMVAVIGIALGGHITKGYPARIPAPVAETLAYENSFAPSYRRCLFVRNEVPALDLESAPCRFGPPDTPPSVALWGDSHAGRLAEPLGNALAAKGLGMVELALSSCQPVPGLINVSQNRARQCPAFNALVMDYLARHPEITDIVLFATWNSYLFPNSGPGLDGYDKEDGFYSVPLGAPAPRDQATRAEAFAGALTDLFATLGPSRRITLVIGLPRPMLPIPRLYAGALWRGTPVPDKAGFPRAYERALGDPARELFARAIARAGLEPDRIRLVDPADAFCDATSCAFIRNGKLLYSDGNHPSLDGLGLMLPPIVAAIARE